MQDEFLITAGALCARLRQRQRQPRNVLSTGSVLQLHSTSNACGDGEDPLSLYRLAHLSLAVPLSNNLFLAEQTVFIFDKGGASDMTCGLIVFIPVLFCIINFTQPLLLRPSEAILCYRRALVKCEYFVTTE